MDDISEKISSILNDEESMRQIKELAEMFGGGNNAENNAPPPSDAGSAKAGSADNAGFAGLGLNIDPIAISKLMSAFNRTDETCALIIALKPLLSADKQLKADRALKMLRIFNVYTAMRDSGMLDSLDKIF